MFSFFVKFLCALARQIGRGLSTHLASALYCPLGFHFVKSAGVYLPIRSVHSALHGLAFGSSNRLGSLCPFGQCTPLPTRLCMAWLGFQFVKSASTSFDEFTILSWLSKTVGNRFSTSFDEFQRSTHSS